MYHTSCVHMRQNPYPCTKILNNKHYTSSKIICIYSAFFRLFRLRGVFGDPCVFLALSFLSFFAPFPFFSLFAFVSIFAGYIKNIANKAPFKDADKIYCNNGIISSISWYVVNNLANVPANCKNVVIDANAPVDF